MATQRRKRVTVKFSTDLQLGPDALTVYKIERIYTKWSAVGGEKEYEDDVRVVQYRIDPTTGSRTISDIVQGAPKLLERWVEHRTGKLIRIPDPNAQGEENETLSPAQATERVCGLPR